MAERHQFSLLAAVAAGIAQAGALIRLVVGVVHAECAATCTGHDPFLLEHAPARIMRGRANFHHALRCVGFALASEAEIAAGIVEILGQQRAVIAVPALDC